MNLKSINASPEYQKSSDMPDECEAIRYMSSEEIPECVQVIRNAFKTVADEFGFTEANAPRFTAFATDEGRLWYHFCKEKRPMFVYMIADKIVGYYSIALLNETEAELNNLGVLPEYRHKNIGRNLLEDCIASILFVRCIFCNGICHLCYKIIFLILIIKTSNTKRNIIM